MKFSSSNICFDKTTSRFYRLGSYYYDPVNRKVVKCSRDGLAKYNISYYLETDVKNRFVNTLNVSCFYNKNLHNIALRNTVIYATEFKVSNHSFRGHLQMSMNEHYCSKVSSICGDYKRFMQLVTFKRCENLICKPTIPKRNNFLICFSNFNAAINMQWQCKIRNLYLNLNFITNYSTLYYQLLFRYIKPLNKQTLELKYYYLAKPIPCVGMSYLFINKSKVLEKFYFNLPKREPPILVLKTFLSDFNVTWYFKMYPPDNEIEFSMAFHTSSPILTKYYEKRLTMVTPTIVQLKEIYFFDNCSCSFIPLLIGYNIKETQILLPSLSKSVSIPKSKQPPCVVISLCSKCVINLSDKDTHSFYFSLVVPSLQSLIYMYTYIADANIPQRQVFNQVGINDFKFKYNDETLLRCYKLFYYATLYNTSVSPRWIRYETIMIIKKHWLGVFQIPYVNNLKIPQGLNMTCRYSFSQGKDTEFIVLFEMSYPAFLDYTYVKNNILLPDLMKKSFSEFKFEIITSCSVITYSSNTKNEWCTFYEIGKIHFYISAKGLRRKHRNPRYVVILPRIILLEYEIYYSTKIYVKVRQVNPYFQFSTRVEFFMFIPLEFFVIRINKLKRFCPGIFAQLFYKEYSSDKSHEEDILANYVVINNFNLFLRPKHFLRGKEIICYTGVVDRLFIFNWTCLIGYKFENLINITTTMENNSYKSIFYNIILINPQTIQLDYLLPVGIYKCRCTAILMVNKTSKQYVKNVTFDLTFVSYIYQMGEIPGTCFFYFIFIILALLILYIFAFMRLIIFTQQCLYVEAVSNIMSFMLTSIKTTSRVKKKIFFRWAFHQKLINIFEIQEIYQQYIKKKKFLRTHKNDIAEVMYIQDKMRVFTAEEDRDQYLNQILLSSPLLNYPSDSVQTLSRRVNERKLPIDQFIHEFIRQSTTNEDSKIVSAESVTFKTAHRRSINLGTIDQKYKKPSTTLLPKLEPTKKIKRKNELKTSIIPKSTVNEKKSSQKQKRKKEKLRMQYAVNLERNKRKPEIDEWKHKEAIRQSLEENKYLDITDKKEVKSRIAYADNVDINKPKSHKASFIDGFDPENIKYYRTGSPQSMSQISFTKAISSFTSHTSEGPELMDSK